MRACKYAYTHKMVVVDARDSSDSDNMVDGC